MKLIIVSGLSGSGKSVALATLEDLNDYCVDNLPLALLNPFVAEIHGRTHPGFHTAAVGIDSRNFRDELAHFPEVIDALRADGVDIEIVFLLADDDTLIKRFSDTRRRHPLSADSGMPLLEAIHRERALLEPIAALADTVIDTSHTNVHELRELVRVRLHGDASGGMSLMFESFGFKHGLPDDADFVFDVRHLPNPHWQTELRQLTGRDAAVIAYLEAHAAVERLLNDLVRFLETWIPAFEAGNRSYLTVAVGCTGGQHRSVYLVERLTRHFRDGRRHVATRHRELP
ncbi:UPF0042 nucleotide-binding protein [Plasticicumulans lactativorans]|uniref:UPF0042 nucleotide-binding protein n=1 Tax=Plasticicumulans lactativorans TaxID=1133106 RepID=A0A4R2L4F9_9GAMM|nr:RNase adapter RapZ [Plasticicumulans lactativorans]TCO80137.1 UPF0042 nucleotide-binding protein [Plasticicumulans lactativorans]